MNDFDELRLDQEAQEHDDTTDTDSPDFVLPELRGWIQAEQLPASGEGK